MNEATPPRVELFSRAAITGGRTRQHRVCARLAALDEAGWIEGVTHRSIEGRVRGPVDGDDPAARTVEWYDRFERWADTAGVALSPFFDCYERTSELAGETYEEIVFPVLSLAVIREDRIETVAPHVDGDGPTTVEDCIEDLAAEPERDRREAGESSGASRRRTTLRAGR